MFVVFIGLISWLVASANTMAAEGEASLPLFDFAQNPGSIVIETDDVLRTMDSFSFSMTVRFASFRSGNFFWMNEHWNRDGFYFQFYQDHLVLGFGNNNALTQITTSPNLFRENVWYQLSGVKDRDVARLFVDGREVATGVVAADIADTQAGLMIGSGTYSPAVAIRDFKLWAEPLTPQEIAVSGRGPQARTPLIHYDFAIVDGVIANLVSPQYSAVFQDLEPSSEDHGNPALAPAPAASPPVQKGAGLAADDGVGQSTVAVAARQGQSTPAASTAGAGGDATWSQAAALVLVPLLPLAVFACARAVGRRHGPLRRWSADGTTADGTNDAAEARKLLPKADVERIVRKLEHAMAAERRYRDPNLTLRQLSEATGVTEHRISEVLNQHMQTSFYDFVNSQRIAEAKLLLTEDVERPILDVAMAVGFNTKSTFYAAFKKSTEQSPAAFRRAVPDTEPSDAACCDDDDGSADDAPSGSAPRDASLLETT